MKKGSVAGYSSRTFFKDQLKLLGNRACKDPKVCAGFLFDFWWDVNKEIIRNGYEYKIGSRGGYLRIGLSKKGEFFWYWDTRNDYTQLPHKTLWKFEPVRGWQKPVEIGERGLKKWIFECSRNPKLSKYSIPEKYPHRTFK